MLHMSSCIYCYPSPPPLAHTRPSSNSMGKTIKPLTKLVNRSQALHILMAKGFQRRRMSGCVGGAMCVCLGERCVFVEPFIIASSDKRNAVVIVDKTSLTANSQKGKTNPIVSMRT